jgi:dTDP-4-amino-4,6-dideoxygalactose transaminase
MREKGTDKHAFLSDPLRKGYYEYVDRGNSYVQSNILGALGRSQLKKIDRLNDRRKKIAEYYCNELTQIEGLELRPDKDEIEGNWHLFYILVPPEEKNFILEALDKEGIGVNIHYSPLHINSFYNRAAIYNRYKLNGSLEFFNRLIRIPMYASLSGDKQEKVVQAVKKVFG